MDSDVNTKSKIRQFGIAIDKMIFCQDKRTRFELNYVLLNIQDQFPKCGAGAYSLKSN